MPGTRSRPRNWRRCARACRWHGQRCCRRFRLNASTAKVVGGREFGNSLNQSVEVPLDYESPQASLNLRTPLFNYEALSRLRQATSVADGAEALLAARHIDLVNRLTAAYLEVLIAARSAGRWPPRTCVLCRPRPSARRRRFTRRRGHGAGGHGRRSRRPSWHATACCAVQDDVVIARRALQRITGLDADGAARRAGRLRRAVAAAADAAGVDRPDAAEQSAAALQAPERRRGELRHRAPACRALPAPGSGRRHGAGARANRWPRSTRRRNSGRSACS